MQLSHDVTTTFNASCITEQVDERAEG